VTLLDPPVGWPLLDRLAYSGPAGAFIDAITPETEADPAALLAALLAAFGNVVGPGPYVRVGGTRHTPRLFVAVVGQTARARKGLGWSLVQALMSEVDPAWVRNRIVGGFGSGEAVVDAVRDPEDGDGTLPPDPRLLIREPELARVLQVVERDSSTLSPIVREAWDGGTLAVRTRRSRVIASRTHISVVGDITLDELLMRLNALEISNGFANRFLWVLARRARVLPSGGHLGDALK
jgi:hypothetical protein